MRCVFVVTKLSRTHSSMSRTHSCMYMTSPSALENKTYSVCVWRKLVSIVSPQH